MLLQILKNGHKLRLNKVLSSCSYFNFSSSAFICASNNFKTSIRQHVERRNDPINLETKQLSTSTNSLQNDKEINVSKMEVAHTDVLKLPKVYASLSKWYLTCKYKNDIYYINLLFGIFSL